jgi:hypothetical protein
MSTTQAVEITEEVAAIEHALNRLLRGAIDEETYRQARGTALVLTRAELSMETKTSELLRNPVGEACRMAIRKLGKRLYELGGLQLMTDVCDRVGDMDQAHSGQRIDIMDKRWDGIGSDGKTAGAWRS